MDSEEGVQLFATARPNKKQKVVDVATPTDKANKRAGPGPAREPIAAGAEGDKRASAKPSRQQQPTGANGASDAGGEGEGAGAGAAERSGGVASTSGHTDLSDVPTDFKGLGLSEWLCGVCKSLGMSQPTDVQRGCIPAILKGRDVIGLAQTGSGKTAAFALPILQALAKDPYGVFALVLTPTR